MASQGDASPARIQVMEAAVEGEIERVGLALGAEVAAAFGPRDEAALSLMARDGAGAPVGGLLGASHWRWLYVRQLWVAPEARGTGVGRALMERAEAIARARGCAGAYLDTFSPDAARFYAAMGYAEAGRIEGFPPGHARRYFAKRFES
ncbi:MAG: GNAT family N-acetyltransferase [Hyphomicrobiales bacterium]|nr:GNAT family N-acetyltransferase [Hyphomicrobiales bacterium]